MPEQNSLIEVLLPKEVQHIEDQLKGMEQQNHHIPLDNSVVASQIGFKLQQLRQSYILKSAKEEEEEKIKKTPKSSNLQSLLP